MKKILYFIIILVVIIGAALIVIPTFFKDDVKSILIKEMDKVMDAKTDFKDFDLSLFRAFPHFSAEFNEFSVVGKSDFEGDTLVNVKKLAATVDLISVFNDKPIKIISIHIDKPNIYTKVLDNGKANYDIFKSTDQSNVKEDSDSNIKLSLQKFTIDHAHIIYDNLSSNIFLEIIDLNHYLSGNLSSSSSFITTQTHAETVNFRYNNIPYLAQQTIDIDLDLKANFDSALYTISNNKILINEIPLESAGSVQMLDEGTNIDINLYSKTDRFKPLLSLIPSIYKNDDFNAIQTDGKLDIKAFVKGLYSDNSMPAYQANILVNDAFFKYADLPSKVERINIDLLIDNKTGNTKDLIVEASDFSFYLENNFFNGKLLLNNIEDDPYIKSRMNGELNLATLQKVFKIENIKELFGKIELDLNVNGNISAIDNQNYENFKALGYANFADIKVNYDEMVVDVPNAQFNFTPQYVNMPNMSLVYNDTKVVANGKITNILGYIFKDQKLNGNINLTSNEININNLMVEESETSGSTEETELELPKNMDITLNAKVNTVIYDKLQLNNVIGQVHVGDQTITLEKIMADALNGKIALDGKFTKLDVSDPTANIHFNLSDVSLAETIEKVGMIEKLAPILSQANGDINLDFNLKTSLDNQLNILYPTLFSSGLFHSNMIAFADINTLNKLSDKLNINEIKKPVLNDLNVDFLVEEGNLIIKPFDFKYKNIEGSLGGKTNLNKNIDYEMKLNIPSNLFGTDMSQVVNNLSSKVKGLGVDYKMGKTIPIVALIGGNITNPQINLQIFEGGQAVQEVIQQQIENVIDTVKTEVNQQINEKLENAKVKANQLIEEARAKANTLIEKAEVASQKLKDETDEKAQKIIKKAEGENSFVQLAAKKSAEELKNTGYKQADNITKEARIKANKLIDEAQQKGNELIEKAKRD